MGENLKRLGFPWLGRAIRRHEKYALVRWLLHLLVKERHEAMRARFWLAWTKPFRRLATCGNGTVIFFREVNDVLCVDIAGHDENRVFGGIVTIIISERVGPFEAFDLMAPADDRLAIGMLRKQRRLHGFIELIRWVGIGAHPPFLEDDVALRPHHLVRKDKVLHPVGLIFHADA